MEVPPPGEHEKNRRGADPASRAKRTRRAKKVGRHVAVGSLRFVWGVIVAIVTVAVIGCLTAVMGLGIFKENVDTTLAPTLQVNADDYTMKLSSVFYYQDKESGEWVE